MSKPLEEFWITTLMPVEKGFYQNISVKQVRGGVGFVSPGERFSPAKRSRPPPLFSALAAV